MFSQVLEELRMDAVCYWCRKQLHIQHRKIHRVNAYLIVHRITNEMFGKYEAKKKKGKTEQTTQAEMRNTPNTSDNKETARSK